MVGQHILAVFEHNQNLHPPSSDPRQRAFRTSRPTADDISTALHAVGTHLENSNSYNRNNTTLPIAPQHKTATTPATVCSSWCHLAEDTEVYAAIPPDYGAASLPSLQKSLEPHGAYPQGRFWMQCLAQYWTLVKNRLHPPTTQQTLHGCTSKL